MAKTCLKGSVSETSWHLCDEDAKTRVSALPGTCRCTCCLLSRHDLGVVHASLPSSMKTSLHFLSTVSCLLPCQCPPDLGSSSRIEKRATGSSTKGGPSSAPKIGKEMPWWVPSRTLSQKRFHAHKPYAHKPMWSFWDIVLQF